MFLWNVCKKGCAYLYPYYGSEEKTVSEAKFPAYRAESTEEVRQRSVQLIGTVMGYVEEARENHVKKKVEEALRSKMKQKALKECENYAAKYAECASGRTMSVVWKCREQANQLNQCLHQYTNDHVLEQMKKEYMMGRDL